MINIGAILGGFLKGFFILQFLIAMWNLGMYVGMGMVP